MSKRITDLTASSALTGGELVEVSQVSDAVAITAATISAVAADNSYNDSGNGFVAAGFEVGNRVKVTGFTGNVANNIFVATITALTTGKMTIGGTEGDVIVDDAAGESVTIEKWTSRRATAQEIADLGGRGLEDHDFDARDATGSASAYAGGIWFGNLITIDETGYIDSVVYSLNTAEAGIDAHPVIYANNAGAAGALLAEGPTVNNGALGDNVLPLDAPLAVTVGDELWVGCYQANTGGIDATMTAGAASNYFIDTLPPNDPGGALTAWSERLRIFARGRGIAPVIASPSIVQTEAGNYTLDPDDMGNYIRLTAAAAKTISIDLDSTTALPDNGEWHFRNVGAGDATIDPDVGVTVNPPADGTLVVPQGGTITLKRAAVDEFDLLGQTVAA